jgi:DNA mismatch endonuclease (patch repair protein)
MTDVFTKRKRSAVMRAIRSKGNRDTELRLLNLLRSAHLHGWRRCFPIMGKPDFCFPKAKVAIFVDGCFWHACPKHGRKPTSNTTYWQTKLERNVTRDAVVVATLRRAGWRVMRIWEHDLATPEKVTKRIQKLLAKTKFAIKENLTPRSKNSRIRKTR